jgi:hypothetical protein
MKHTECEDCKLSDGDCGHHFKMDGITNFGIPAEWACNQFGDCGFFTPRPIVAKNCPYCNEPAGIDVTVGYTQIYCPSRYSCGMPYVVVHKDKEEAVKAWNKLVEQINQED